MTKIKSEEEIPEHEEDTVPLLSQNVESDLEEPNSTAKCAKPSLLSRATFWWANSLALTGSSKTITVSDLFPLSAENRTADASARFDAKWKHNPKWTKAEFDQLEQTKGNYWAFVHLIRRPGVLSTLLKSFLSTFVFGATLTLASNVFNFLNPMLLRHLIGIVSMGAEESTLWSGISVAILMFLVSLGNTLLGSYIQLSDYTLIMRLRAALFSAIYRKSLTLSSSARKEKTTGEMINLMQTDAEQVAYLGWEFNRIWSLPLELCLSLYFLWAELGASMFVGITILLAMFPFNAWSSNKETEMYEAQSELTDERVKVINEVLGGIRVIKLYGWEVPFIRKITDIREREMEQYRKINRLNGYISMFWSCSSFGVTLATFAYYLLTSDTNDLTAQKVFVSMHLFNMMKSTMSSLPYTIASLNTSAISVRRLTKFLNANDLEQYVTRQECGENSVMVQNGTFAWDKDHTSTLSGIDLKVPKGSLVAIVGQVGSGKSSMLSAILGDMERIEGSVNIDRDESIAYVAQQAWIQNATLRSNILFGSEYHQTRYDKIIEACALAPDIAILPGGDQTEIGEKGINLSGGQKQRVAIARACYSSASLVLLDDPLSAVDSHVAKHIFRKVLSNKHGLLRDRTRILVTNNIAFLPQFDQIIVLVNGQITESGTYQDLMLSGGNFFKFAAEHSLNEALIERQSSVDSAPKTPITPFESGKPIFPTSSAEQSGKLIDDEETDRDSVKLSVYLQYIRSISWKLLIATVFLIAASSAMSTGQDVYLAIWSSESSKAVAANKTITSSVNASLTTSVPNVTVANTTSSGNQRLLIYGAFGVAEAALAFISLSVHSYGTLKSASNLHETLLTRIMRAPMRFFDTTPIGRIVNRFSSDIDTVGSSLLWNIDGLINCLLSVITNVVLIAAKTPLLLALICPISWLYYYIQRLYNPTSRQLERLSSAHKSPIHTHFDETLAGASTIRAFGRAGTFLEQSDHRVDLYQRCYYTRQVMSQWLYIRLQLCANLVELLAALFAVAARGTVEPGFVSLIITYSAGLTNTLNWVVTCTTRLGQDLVSVERINDYCEMETEMEWTRAENIDPELPDGWPQKGEIEFANYSVRYREGLDLVLKDLSLKIEAGEKVGVVGRTGAGKSSLTLALFRILEADQGHIAIDGVPIEAIGLHELREKLSIIPQDPVLFSGTIRSNLDPFGLYRDELLLDALSHCHMRQYIESTELGLDHPVAENGSNLSVGQRQLICLGRALLRRTKILVLDEATAAIDLETDSLIQETIRREFAHCTVITIAHRLNTILDSNRVLVLNKGQVAEFDTPANLLQNTKSMFYSLAKDARLV